jgi:serine/threonine-protein kinase
MTVRTGLLPDRYTGAQPVGRGGMGEIYRATDTSLGRAVAVKLLAERYAEDEQVRERFTREALAAARLSGNSNIVTIFDVGEWGGRPFIVMEYLAGGSLEERLRAEGAQPPARALAWLEEAAAALDAAHREGVVHRDVKPANLLLDRHDRVHVADFGIASAAGLGSLTETGTVLGTASYLSPEQAKGERTTSASDRYSLAIVAFELLTGRRPFEGDSVAAEAAAHVTGEVPSVCDLNPELPCEIDPVFRKALAKDPAQRYASAAEFVASLRQSVDDAAGSTAVIRPAGRVERRRRGLLLPLLAVLALGAVAAGIAAALIGGNDRRTAQPPPRTVTRPGTTVQQTVTTTPAATAPAPVQASDPAALNDQGWALMKQGNYDGALPLLQQSVAGLQGRGDLTEAYASYNLGYTLMQLGRCSDALPYLERSRELQPSRKEVKDALKQARRC